MSYATSTPESIVGATAETNQVGSTAGATVDTNRVGATSDPQAGGLFAVANSTVLSGVNSVIAQNALLAKGHADNAATSESNAAISEANALSYSNSATASATSATASAASASTSATSATASATAAAASAVTAAENADTSRRIGGKLVPTATPTNNDLLKYDGTSEVWVYSQEIDAGTF